jgi:hypothetical protein
VGLIKAIQDACVAESGLEFVDSKGKPLARFGTNSGGSNFERKLAVSTDSEIMRGDLVKVPYDAGVRQRAEIYASNKNAGVTQGGGSLQYEFGQTATELTQCDDGGVDVTFADGRQAHYDLNGGGGRRAGLADAAARVWGRGQRCGAAVQWRISMHTHSAYYSIPRLTTTSRAPTSRTAAAACSSAPETVTSSPT